MENFYYYGKYKKKETKILFVGQKIVRQKYPRISFRCEQRLIDELIINTKENKLSLSNLIKDVLTEYINKMKKERYKYELSDIC